MSGPQTVRLIQKAVHWSLTVATVVYIISGFGITEFRIIESLTFGLLSRNLAFRIHTSLEIPFIILLLVHIALPRTLRLLHRSRSTAREEQT